MIRLWVPPDGRPADADVGEKSLVPVICGLEMMSLGKEDATNGTAQDSNLADRAA
jgi:hypothetical protein